MSSMPWSVLARFPFSNIGVRVSIALVFGCKSNEIYVCRVTFASAAFPSVPPCGGGVLFLENKYVLWYMVQSTNNNLFLTKLSNVNICTMLWPFKIKIIN